MGAGLWGSRQSALTLCTLHDGFASGRRIPRREVFRRLQEPGAGINHGTSIVIKSQFDRDIYRALQNAGIFRDVRMKTGFFDRGRSIRRRGMRKRPSVS